MLDTVAVTAPPRPVWLAPPPLAPRAFSAGLVGAGVLLMAAAVPFALQVTDPAPFHETAATLGYRIQYVLVLTGLLVLAATTPSLRGLASGERRIPGWLVTAALVATCLNAATAFIQVFVIAWLHAEVPAALEIPAGGVLMAGMASAWVLYMLAWVGVAVAGYRTRTVPAPAGALIALGAVVQVVIGPLAGVPFGLGLILLAHQVRRSTSAISTGPA